MLQNQKSYFLTSDSFCLIASQILYSTISQHFVQLAMGDKSSSAQFDFRKIIVFLCFQCCDKVQAGDVHGVFSYTACVNKNATIK